MGKIIDTDDINKKKLKLSVFICNMVIIALCLTGILAMILGHFFRLDLKLELTEENAGDIIESVGGEDLSFDTSVLKDNPIKIPVYLQIKGTTIISCIWTDGEKIVEKFVDEQIDNIAAQMKPLFKAAAKAAVQVAIPEVKKELVNQVKQNMADKYGDKSDEEVMAALEKDYGFKEESINKALDDVIDELFVEDRPAEPEKVKEIINAAIDENTSKALENDLLKQEDVDKIKDQVGDNLDSLFEELSDSNGNFDPYILLNKALDGDLGDLLGSIGNFGAEAKNDSVAFKKVANTNESEALQEFKTKLHDMVTEALGENTKIINLVFSILGALWLLSILCFAELLILTVLKTFLAKNKTVSVFLACFFNFPGHFIIAALNIVASNLPKILDMAGVGADAGAFVNAISISFSSINWIATLCAFIMISGGWFYYRLLKKQVKALVRENLIDKSIFEKDDYNPFEATPDFVGSSVRETSSTKTVENGSYVKKNGITYYNLYGTKDYDDMDFEETKTQSPIDR